MTLDYVSESAFHEAAHAIVAAYLKMPLRYATAVPSEENVDGHVMVGTKRVQDLHLESARRVSTARSDQELEDISRDFGDKQAVVALAARAAMEKITFESEDGSPLPLYEGQYDGDEKALRTIAGEMDVDDFAGWRERQLQRAREIVAMPHVVKAIDLVATYLEIERIKHANRDGNGRLAAKEVRWALRAFRSFEKRKQRAA